MTISEAKIASGNGGTYGISREHTSRAWYCANVSATLDYVDRMDIICVDESSTNERTHELRKPVYRNLLPGEVSEDGEGQCDGRIEMTTRITTRDPDPDSDTCKERAL